MIVRSRLKSLNKVAQKIRTPQKLFVIIQDKLRPDDSTTLNSSNVWVFIF